MAFFVVNNGIDQIAVEASSPREAREKAAHKLVIAPAFAKRAESDILALGVDPLRTLDDLKRFFGDDPRFIGGDKAELKFTKEAIALGVTLTEAQDSVIVSGKEGPGVVGLPGVSAADDPDSDVNLLKEAWFDKYGLPLPDYLANDPEAVLSLMEAMVITGEPPPDPLTFEQQKELAGIAPPPIPFHERMAALVKIHGSHEQRLELARIGQTTSVERRSFLILKLANDLARTKAEFMTLEDRISFAKVINSGPESVATINAAGELAVVSTQGMTQVEIERMRGETDTAITLLETEAGKDIARITTGTEEQRLAELFAQFGDPENRALIARGGLSPEQVLLQTAIESGAGLRDFEAQIRGNPAILGALTASGGVGAAGALIEKFNPFNIFKQAQDQGVFGLGGVPQGGQAGSGVFLNASGEQVRLGPGGNVIEIGGSVPTISGLPQVGAGAMPTFPEFENPGLDIKNPILARMLPRLIGDIKEGGASTLPLPPPPPLFDPERRLNISF